MINKTAQVAKPIPNPIVEEEKDSSSDDDAQINHESDKDSSDDDVQINIPTKETNINKKSIEMFDDRPFQNVVKENKNKINGSQSI